MTALSCIRRRLEGLDYLAHRPRGLATRQPSYNRQRLDQGLTLFRQAWWWQAQLESYPCLRRYAFLLDWAVGEAVQGSRFKVQGEESDQPSTDPAQGSRFKVQEEESDQPSTFNLQPSTSFRVIILRMGHLGDILHLMPTVREMKRQRPGWTLELVTGPWSKSLAKSFGLFDKVYDYCPDVVQYHRGDRSHVRSVADEKSFIRELQGSGVDLLFCPGTPHFCELPLVVGLGAHRYVGETLPLEVVPRQDAHATKPFDSRQYEMNAVADFLPLMGLERPIVSLMYPLEAEAEAKAKKWMKENVGAGKLLLLFPGSGWPGKNWPPEAFAALADNLIKEKNLTVALAGSPGEAHLCDRVRLHMTASAPNLAGRFSLGESAALIAQSAGIIGNDSAPLHLAAALDVPTVSLWGPTFPEKWAPRGPKHVTVKATEPCAGCHYWHVNATCRRSPGCIESIKHDAVKSAVDQIVQVSSITP